MITQIEVRERKCKYDILHQNMISRLLPCYMWLLLFPFFILVCLKFEIKLVVCKWYKKETKSLLKSLYEKTFNRSLCSYFKYKKKQTCVAFINMQFSQLYHHPLYCVIVKQYGTLRLSLRHLKLRQIICLPTEQICITRVHHYLYKKLSDCMCSSVTYKTIKVKETHHIKKKKT